MIKTQSQMIPEQREAMRGGKGTVTVTPLWEPETELKAPQRLFARLSLPIGASIGEHRHDHEEEVYYVISGVAESCDGGKTVVLNPGDSSLTQDGESHYLRNLGDTPLEVLAVVTRYTEK